MKQHYTPRRQPPRDPNWRTPVDTSRCAKSRDGKHRWLTTYQTPKGAVEALAIPVCEACLELDERAA